MEERCRTFRKLPLKLSQLVIVAAFLLTHCLPAIAQTGIRVTGVVTSDADGLPLIGVNVIQRGTTNGTVTNFDGNYELTVPVNSTLEFSYIGHTNQQVTVTAGRSQYNIVMKEGSQSLDEVVVVGYGVQKKKLVTGATVQVGGDDLQKLSTISAFSALQSQTPGVNITQISGMPGEGFKVNIRGVSTIGNSDPLYVIDGISGGNLNNLNPADIESIDVLKDAASSAIYGSRGANGVILITTKRGKTGKPQVSYDGYVGVQNPYKMPALLNAREYMAIQDETRINEGNIAYNWENELPIYLYDSIMDGSWNGTNWAEEFRHKDALIQNHAINILGGGETSQFSLGFSYADQDGILGQPTTTNHTRYTARINSDHIVYKVGDLNVIKIGQTLNYGHRSRSGAQGIGNIFWNDFHNMLVGSPLLPVYNKEGDWYMQKDKVEEGWNLQGSIGNPMADYALGSRSMNDSRNFELRSSAYVEIQPIQNLILRSQFGYNSSSWTSRSYNGSRQISTTSEVPLDRVSQSAGGGYDIAWTNTINYNFDINQEHSFGVMLGQEIIKSGMGVNLELGIDRSLFPGSFKHAYINNTNAQALNEVATRRGDPWGMGRMASFFGRMEYNYKETYMATITLRADGSSNFARGHRWGYFPSVSAGWIISNEGFFDSLRNSGFDYLRLRGSWGQNGNQSIDNFQYLATIAMDDQNAYYFGENKETPTQGAYADILPNNEISWETAEMIDVGLDVRFLSSRLGVVFDWYRRNKKDWLVRAPQLASYGTNAPFINGGDLRNQGFELSLDWNDRVGDFTYGANINFSKFTNKVTRIANSEGIIHGPANVLSQGTTEMFRAQVGEPIGFFWGYKTEGIFQNQAQIESYRAAGKGVLDTAQPGDVIFADANGDGSISDADKVNIGDPNPDFTAGLSLNFGYKGFDLSLTAYGQFGFQIAKSYRSFADSPLQNYTTDIFGRWYGEGTSNKLPRLTSGSHTNWQNVSDIYIEDGDFVKLQNITIGYDFKKLFPKMPLGQARLYVTAQNVFTITGYSGLDPEIGYSDYNWSKNIDLGFYPSPRTYMVGVNLKF
ncbi:MAG: TonB-dependent receptor [Tannerellaceae bacterium]|jgi:TonB-linked SusC/RagA family outer membrane protein|nr:TonB-dependent receptor [Tannerellaceae bacterium]